MILDIQDKQKVKNMDKVGQHEFLSNIIVKHKL